MLIIEKPVEVLIEKPLGLYNYFLTNAPSVIPDWFQPEKSTEKQRYFRWRVYYAEQMLKVINNDFGNIK